MMFGRRTRISILASLVWIGLSAAGCGPPDDGNEDTTEGGADTTADVADAGPDVGPDTGGGDTGITPDGGDATDGGTDAMDVADADGGGSDTTDAADGGTDGGDADGGAQHTAFVGAAAKREAREGTVYASTSPTSGTVDHKMTWETKQLVVDDSDGTVYALNRRCSGFGEQEGCKFDQGVIYELDVSTNGQISVADTYELPKDVYNPHGVGYVETAGDLFVSSYFTSDIYRFGSAGTPAGTRDVAPFDAGATEMDTDPEASDISVHGDYVLVTLLRLSGFQPKENSALAVLDTTSGEFVDFDNSTDGVQALDLGRKNAKAGTYRGPDGNWTVGFTGKFQDENMNTALDGAIVALESSQPGDYSVGETIIDEKALGGNLLDYVMVGPDNGVAMISSGMSTTAVHFESDGTVETLMELGGFTEALCASPDASKVWVGAPAPEGTPSFVAYDTSSWSKISGAKVEVEGTPSSCGFQTD